MKSFYILLVLSLIGFSKTRDSIFNKSLVKNQTESTPEFPGGSKAMDRFIVENLRYPEEDLKNKTEGLVYISVIIDKEGKPKDAKIY